VYTLRVGDKENFVKLLETHGTVPTPPYIHTTLNANDLQERYQTIFAKDGASVAAPTASLHFTDAVFASLAHKDIGVTKLKLDVGLGTFAPVRQEHMDRGELHTEPYQISHTAAKVIHAAKG